MANFFPFFFLILNLIKILACYPLFALDLRHSSTLLQKKWILEQAAPEKVSTLNVEFRD